MCAFTPNVSIVVPVYNAADYLKESLGDILRQTYSDFELICVNDGSTDNSYEVLKAFADTDKRIRIVDKINGGGGSARNAGADMAQGEYLLFLDADDRFERDLLEKTVRLANKENCDVVIFSGNEFHYKTHEVKTSPWLLQRIEGEYDGNPFHYTTTTVWNKLYRRDYLTRFCIRHQEERVTAFSMYFTFFSLIYTSKISFLDEVLVHYRSDNPDSSMRRHDNSPLDTIKVLEAIWNRIEADDRLIDKRSIYVNFAIKNIFERTGWFKSYDAFSQVYDELHHGGFERIGLSSMNDCLIEDKCWLEQKKRMEECSLPEYLFTKEKDYEQRGILPRTVYYLPENIINKLNQECCRVVIYGAGLVGNSYYLQLRKMENVNIVCWVDKNYKDIGFPIQSTSDLNDIPYEYIIIAVEHDRYINEICATLSEMGVDSEKMLWGAPGKVI